MSSLPHNVTPLREGDGSVAVNLGLLINDYAEQALLGAVLISNRAYDRAAEFVQQRDFGNGVHGRIWAAIGHLIDYGINANPVTLKNFFDQDGALKDIGGAQYLARLATSAITVTGAEDYARNVRDLSRRRDLIVACQEAISDASTVDVEKPAERVIEDHQTQLALVSDGHGQRRGMISIAEAARLAVEATERAYKGESVSLRTGLADLDDNIGGLLPSDLVVLAGRPAMGKTAAALCIASHAAKTGFPPAFFSLEQSAEQLAQRLLARRSGVSATAQQRGKLDSADWEPYLREQRFVSSLPFFVDDTSALSVGQICVRARRAHRRYGIKLVVVDHLQLVRAERQREARRLEIDHITGSLKALAKELGLPVLLLSQLTRGIESRDDKRPTLHDLRESGTIEQDADRVIFIYREEYYLTRRRPSRTASIEEQNVYREKMHRCAGLAELIIGKDRHGPGGSVTVHWNAERMAFEDLARQYPQHDNVI
jgi:replicative DNA helicase